VAVKRTSLVCKWLGKELVPSVIASAHQCRASIFCVMSGSVET